MVTGVVGRARLCPRVAPDGLHIRAGSKGRRPAEGGVRQRRRVQPSDVGGNVGYRPCGGCRHCQGRFAGLARTKARIGGGRGMRSRSRRRDRARLVSMAGVQGGQRTSLHARSAAGRLPLWLSLAPRLLRDGRSCPPSGPGLFRGECSCSPGSAWRWIGRTSFSLSRSAWPSSPSSNGSRPMGVPHRAVTRGDARWKGLRAECRSGLSQSASAGPRSLAS